MKKWMSIACQVIAATILVQTLYFKFTGAPESVFIFKTMGVEPVGRILAGIVELIAATLLVIRRLSWLGALIGAGVLTGAVFSHMFILGIVVQNDGGLLFGLALTALCASMIVLILHRAEIPIVGRYLSRSGS